MSNEPPIYQEGETVPVPDKGGWIDGETGPVFGGPPPAPPVEPTGTRRDDDPKADPKTPERAGTKPRTDR